MTIETNTNNAAGSNSNNNVLESYIRVAKDASRLLGDSAAGVDKGLTAMTAATVMIYQTDDYYRSKIDAFITTKMNSKITSKVAKEAAEKWFEMEFEIVKPTSKAMSLAKFKYQNRVNAHVKAFKRAADYYKQGLRFTTDDKGKKFYITLDSYKRVTKDNTATADVEVVAKAGASSDRLTFSSLESGAKKTESKSSKGTTITATAANIATLCKATKQACESADVEKLDGAQRVAALDAFFALQIMLGARVDPTMVKVYDELTKAQAA